MWPNNLINLINLNQLAIKLCPLCWSNSRDHCLSG